MLNEANPLTQGLIEAGENLYLNPQTGEFISLDPGGLGAPNQWAWGDTGIVPIGGVTPTAITTPFLGIQEQYRGGAPITADTWQEAVSKSLEGFMRANYAYDPIFNWQPGQSGMGTGQFRLGTLQELANAQFPGLFFDTTGPLARHMWTGDVVDPATHQQFGGVFDPLLGMAPDTKLLGFEDIPLEVLEKAVGGLPGQIWVSNPQVEAIGRQREALLQQVNELTQQVQGLTPFVEETTPGKIFVDEETGEVVIGEPTSKQVKNKSYDAALARLQAVDAQVRSLDQQLASMGSPLISLAEAQQMGSLQDFNDYIFQLDINRYETPDEIIKATPESVLANFFDLPQYRLMFGNEEGVLDPYASPTDRFRADPGYQWTQDEGMRNVQRNAAAKGLLESGATMRDLTEYGQNLADQNYQRWLGQNSALFSDWQNQLRGVANQGATLSSQSAANAQQTGGILSGLASQLGGNLAGVSQNQAGLLGNLGSQQGTNLANLLANQGVFGGNAFLNTGAAQANTSMNAASLDAQILAAQIQAQASVYSAMLQAQAAAQASQGGGGGGKGGGKGAGVGSVLSGIGSLF